MGTGRGSRLEFRLEWCGVTVGLSARNEATRQLSNFYLKIPGEACLLRGYDETRAQVGKWLIEWGGNLQDEWVRRLDICLDLVGLNLHEGIFPAFKNEQFISTARRNSFYRDSGATTGFGIGASNAAHLRVYDKLAEVLAKKNPAYCRAMIDRRWGGEVPEYAARVEYELRSEFFRQFGIKTAADVEARLADIVFHLTRTDSRPFFMLTESPPDREGRHQNRSEVLAEWAAVVADFRALIGQPRRPMQRVKRELIDQKRSCASVVGYLTSAGAQIGIVIETRSDLANVLNDLLERCDVDDEQIRLKYEDKARRYGTWTEATSFPFGDNLAV